MLLLLLCHNTNHNEALVGPRALYTMVMMRAPPGNYSSRTVCLLTHAVPTCCLCRLSACGSRSAPKPIYYSTDLCVKSISWLVGTIWHGCGHRFARFAIDSQNGGGGQHETSRWPNNMMTIINYPSAHTNTHTHTHKWPIVVVVVRLICLMGPIIMIKLYYGWAQSIDH